MDCGDPPTLENGIISISNQSVAVYECDKDYDLQDGIALRTCLTSGNWSNEDILCTRSESIYSLYIQWLKLFSHCVHDTADKCVGSDCPFNSSALPATVNNVIQTVIYVLVLFLTGQ